MGTVEFALWPCGHETFAVLTAGEGRRKVAPERKPELELRATATSSLPQWIMTIRVYRPHAKLINVEAKGEKIHAFLKQGLANFRPINDTMESCAAMPRGSNRGERSANIRAL